MYDVIIIGAGPAGLSAGVYTARRKLKSLILSKDLGGQTAASWEVENYLGYHLISGQDLAEKFKEHLKDFDIELNTGVEVEKLEIVKPKGFVVKTKAGKDYQAKALIIASGKKPRELSVPGEKELKGRGLTYCATCDAPLFKDKIVAVIGGGNSALEAALQLEKIASKIFLLDINPEFGTNTETVLVDKVKTYNKIEIIHNAQTKEILGEKFVQGLIYEDKKAGKTKKLEVQGVFVEIGSVPATDFCKDVVELNQWQEIKIDEHNMTSVEGIFAAGDVTEVAEKQTVIAAGEGAKAGIAAANYLARLK